MSWNNTTLERVTFSKQQHQWINCLFHISNCMGLFVILEHCLLIHMIRKTSKIHINLRVLLVNASIASIAIGLHQVTQAIATIYIFGKEFAFTVPIKVCYFIEVFLEFGFAGYMSEFTMHSTKILGSNNIITKYVV